MPLDEKQKRLFSDLGRPTRRGVRKCPKCGTVNGTRGNSCKNKSCDVVFRDNGNKKKSTTDACKIIFNNSSAEVFSVRLRDRGPDYRSFVQLTPSQPILVSSDINDADVIFSPGTFPKCFVNSCNRTRIYPCGHIKAAQKCFTTSQRVLIKHSVLSTLNIPQECKQVLSIFVNELPDLLVQRCSKTSFVVKCNTSTKHPLGYLHILFFKPNKEEGSPETKFLCTCRPFKIPGKDSDITRSSDTRSFDLSSKLCMHYYACLTAFASNSDLSLEFEHFLGSITHDYSAGLLGQLHLVTLPSASNDQDDDGMHGNHMSVEIMRENISLLESIADGDDSTLQTVQCLEGVLGDQIIVASVDDSLTFGDSSALEGLDETDSQICIYSTDPSLRFPSVSLAPSTRSIESEAKISSSTSGTKETEPDSSSCQVNEKYGTDHSDDLSISCSTSTSQTLSTTTARIASNLEITKYDKSALFLKASSPRSMVPRQSTQGSSESTSALEKKWLLNSFERWLASVNERINATMNYHLSGKPESLVYYVCHEYFDILRDRITSGWKKKRLPNQTLVVYQRDRAPIGNFTKHVWKITNIVHVLHIFQSNIVPLKLNQFFVQTSTGVYDEWVPQKDDESNKNKSIIPVLHSTSLKIGRIDASVKENVPFNIEWIPDILPESKCGELTLCFQFSHTGPIHTDEERRNSIAPLQKLMQSQVFPFR